ncbi:MAG: selenide, water dikinase SelD [Solirubrobacteraceae bacterium]
MIEESSGLSTQPTPRLTSFARGAGCGCKLPAAELHALLGDLPTVADARVLVGYQSADDAAVVRVSEELALVQTIDFFTPVVDDPRDFGAIAAANALSDVYAMGGQPLSALSIVAFPLDRLGGGVLRAVMEGALAILGEAGVPLVGGHSIDDDAPKFGLAVTGLVHPRHILGNDGARPGDALVLTKPLGTGAIVTHAQQTGMADALPAAVEVMRTLNDAAGRQARAARAHAVTDVTGFGLLGHAHGVARESGVSVVLDADAVPVVEGAAALLEAGVGISGGTRRNAAWAESFTTFAPSVAAWRRWLLADATTSGGLVVALDAAAVDDVSGTVIGLVVDGPAGTIRVQ